MREGTHAEDASANPVSDASISQHDYASVGSMASHSVLAFVFSWMLLRILSLSYDRR